MRESTPAEKGPSAIQLRAWALLACALLTPGAVAGETSHHRVLFLYSYGPNYAPFADFAVGIRKELLRSSPVPVEFFEASLETMRFPKTSVEVPLAAYLNALFRESEIDLVVSVGGPAARFCLEQRGRLFPSTPLLLAGLERRLLDDVTGTPSVTVAGDLPGKIDHILHLLPETNHIALVSTGSILGKFWVEQARQELQPFTDRVDFTFLYQLSLEEMVERVSALPPRTVIFYGGLLVDGAGVPHERDEGLDRLFAAANAPIFGTFDTQLGRGVVGGPLVSVSEASRRGAQAALRILSGEEPSTIQIEPVTAGAPVYDHRQLQRWGIPESSLPQGSTIRFRPVSLWTLYMWPAILGLSLVGAETALLAGLLVQRARRRRAEDEARALSRRLLHAHEDERRRLARELHDDMSQRLARLTIDVGRIEDALHAVSGNGASTAASEGLARLSEDVHSLSYQLHPSLIEDLGLFEALQEECERFSDVEGVPAMLNAAKLSEELPPEASLCLFRVAQEALRNVSRHAHASRVSVTLGPADGGVRLSVVDDGAGFDRREQAKRASLGLASMRERVGLVSGRLQIESGIGRGTAITVWVPSHGGTP